MNKIEEAITEYWGARCPVFEESCCCCLAWSEYDQFINGKHVKTLGRCQACCAIIILDSDNDNDNDRLCDRCYQDVVD